MQSLHSGEGEPTNIELVNNKTQTPDSRGIFFICLAFVTRTDLFETSLLQFNRNRQ